MYNICRICYKEFKSKLFVAERSEAIVLLKTEEDRTKFCSVRWSVLASLSKYLFGFEVDKFSNKKKRPAVLIINGEVRIARVRSVRFCTSTASDALKMFLSLSKNKRTEFKFNQSEPTSIMLWNQREKRKMTRTFN